MISRIVLALLGCALVAAAHGQAYPSRAIRIVVPYAPGGTTDIVGRQMAQRMSEVLSQPVVVENRTGGNTAIGADAVARSAPDGYTLLFASASALAISPWLNKNLPYDTTRSFAPVAELQQELPSF